MCDFRIKIEGEITPATVTGVEHAIAERDQMMKRETHSGGLVDLWIVDIDSPGGSVDTAIALGRLLRSKEAPIVVADDKVCASSCVLVLAGATSRNLRGRVGIHRPYFEAPATGVDVGNVQRAYNDMRDKIRSYLREMNVSDRLADDMMIVPPEKIRFLSADELINYGLGFIDPVTNEAIELKEAQKLGISRAEYMRRKSLTDAISRKNDPNVTLSLECKNAMLSGRHVELAPPCRNMATSCKPWERNWQGRKETNVGDVVTDDGFVISDK